MFVVPGRITDTLSEGCNYLLTQGAGIAISPQVIANELSRYFYKRNDGENFLEHIGCAGISCEKAEIPGEGEDKEAMGGDYKERDSVLRKCILSALDVTPTEFQLLYRRIQDKILVSVEELLLELTRMEMEGTISSAGNYYQKIYHL